jgi:hypothetical protein
LECILSPEKEDVEKERNIKATHFQRGTLG